MRVAAAAVIAFALLADEPKPRVEFRALPQFGFSPLKVHALVIIENGGEHLYCPEVEWNWGDGSRSFENSDCAPYEKSDDTEGPISFGRDHVYGAGEYTLTVTLSRGAKQLRSMTQKIRVMERGA